MVNTRAIYKGLMDFREFVTDTLLPIIDKQRALGIESSGVFIYCGEHQILDIMITKNKECIDEIAKSVGLDILPTYTLNFMHKERGVNYDIDVIDTLAKYGETYKPVEYANKVIETVFIINQVYGIESLKAGYILVDLNGIYFADRIVQQAVMSYKEFNEITGIVYNTADTDIVSVRRRLLSFESYEITLFSSDKDSDIVNISVIDREIQKTIDEIIDTCSEIHYQSLTIRR